MERLMKRQRRRIVVLLHGFNRLIPIPKTIDVNKPLKSRERRDLDEISKQIFFSLLYVRRRSMIVDTNHVWVLQQMFVQLFLLNHADIRTYSLLFDLNNRNANGNISDDH